MAELINEKQLKKMSKIFRKTGKTFQSIARESGLKMIPDHVTEITQLEAREILKKFHYCLVESKGKQ